MRQLLYCSIFIDEVAPVPDPLQGGDGTGVGVRAPGAAPGAALTSGQAETVARAQVVRDYYERSVYFKDLPPMTAETKVEGGGGVGRKCRGRGG